MSRPLGGGQSVLRPIDVLPYERELRASRGARVAINGPDIRILSAGDQPIDLVRAGAAAIWSTGRAIFGFRVPEALYADPFHRP